ncbi:MAG: DUF2281 domain-containing protein [Deltaproteobacteria bacterium]|nr:DUF2281 domain-containing protein [Deltaproteobacteria bacterium]
MSKKELISKELDQIPESFLEEILDFIRFLRTKAAMEKLETAIASESSLQKDWLRPEEDEAWRDL